MTLKELKAKLYRLDYTIAAMMNDSGFKRYGDMSGISYDADDPEEAFLSARLCDILGQLQTVHNNVLYLSKSTKEGCLHKSNYGRYAADFVDGTSLTFTSGSSFEFLSPDGREWLLGDVEYSHDLQDYYLVGYRDVNLDGLRVRVRV